MSKAKRVRVMTGGKRVENAYCAPSAQATFAKTGSCLNLDTLKSVARTIAASPLADASLTATLETFDDSKVQKAGKSKIAKPATVPLLKTGVSTTRLRKMIEAITHKKEHEWADLAVLGDRLRKKIAQDLRPSAPRSWLRNRHEWLDTNNIDSVMRQYETKYKSFKFLGVSARDYDSVINNYGSCVSQPLCQLNLRELRKQGRTRFGVIFNMDRHTQSGSHWVAMYCNFAPSRVNYGVYYYDSLAKPPPREIHKLIETVAEQAIALNPRAGKRFQVGYNTERRQYKNSECGIFSILLLVRCLETDQGFEAICKSTGTDDDVFRYRHVFYRPPSASA